MRNKKAKKEDAIEILDQVLPHPVQANGFSDEERVELIAKKFSEIMEILGMDLSDDSLQDTPYRVADMFVHELFVGLKPENFPKITVQKNSMECDQMVLEKNIRVMSVCEHHFQTIAGIAHVAYIPGEKVIGLSKLNRIVEYFSRRPQVQERLTKQIADTLEIVLETDNVAVYINAKHFCVAARGIQDHSSSTTTSDLRGVFRSDQAVRAEFFNLCSLPG